MLHARTIRLTGWKLLAVVLVGTLVLLLAATVLVVLGVALLALVGVVVLHALVLPRLAQRLGVAPLGLAALLLPLLVGVAWAVTGSLQGLLVALGFWLAGVAAPQLALLWLRRRLTRHWLHVSRTVYAGLPAAGSQEQILEAVRCQRCGSTTWTETPASSGRCPQCGQPRPGYLPASVAEPSPE